MIPLLAGAFALVGIVIAGPLGGAIPRLGAETGTLRLLIAATPLLAWNALELHVRSARGRNGDALRIGIAVLIANLGLCIWLVSAHGLVGAAVALLATETLQTTLLVCSAGREERGLVRSTARTTAALTAVLLLVTVVLS